MKSLNFKLFSKEVVDFISSRKESAIMHKAPTGLAKVGYTQPYPHVCRGYLCFKPITPRPQWSDLIVEPRHPQKSILLHEAPTIMGSRKGQTCAASPLHVERPFPCFKLVAPRSQWSNFLFSSRKA